jgi:putative oxidoreductase
VSEAEAISVAPRRGRVATIALRVLRIVVGIDFIIGGVLKLAGAQIMVDLFDRIGAGQWLRYLVGVVELSGGIGVLIPAVSGLAAIGLCALLTAATFTNLAIGDPLWAPLFWLVLAAIIAWRRWPQTKELLAGRRRLRHASDPHSSSEPHSSRHPA